MRKLVLVLWLAVLPVWPAQPVHARHAMVVTRETHATDAGVAVLQAGGNAVDAAIAVGFALAVTHPSAGNIGGGGFMLVRFADGRSTFIDFRERAPEQASRNMYLDAAGKPTKDSEVGYRAAGVPGTVRGFEYASKKYGKKPWADLVAPAVELAGKGFPVPYGLAESLKRWCSRSSSALSSASANRARAIFTKARRHGCWPPIWSGTVVRSRRPICGITP